MVIKGGDFGQMWMEGQRGLLFGSCKYSHLSRDNIKKKKKKRHTVVDFQCSAFGEVKLLHGMMSLLGGTSLQSPVVKCAVD